jgi:hypothetical protein
MTKGLFFSIIFIALFLFFNNCSKNPVYPETPEIAYVKYEKFSGNDSLVFTISFKDGDGDLGLKNDNNNPPYQEYNFIKDGSGNYIIYDPTDPSMPPYSCKKYATVGSDIVRADYNLNHNNYQYEIYIKQANGTYTKFDDSDLCESRRFPPLVPMEDKGPIEGELTYHIDQFVYANFLNQTVKFKIFIIDRALHQSNIIETPDIFID